MSEEEEDCHWYCVRTLTKRENIAACILKQREDLEILCPKLRYKKATKRGTIWWMEAMFPGYFFAKFSVPHHGRLVAASQGVTGIVKFGSIYPEIPETFICQLREELSQQQVIDKDAKEGGIPDDTLVITPELFPGDEVEIAHGPLAGQKGKVAEILPASDRVAILLEFLGETQKVQVDLYSLILNHKTAT